MSSNFVIETKNFVLRSKVASFDLDWTIIRPKGNTVFSKDDNDWMIFPGIQNFIREKYKDDYCIVIFTNQKNMNLNVESCPFVKKIHSLSEMLKVPLLLYASTKSDIHRKPSIGMWESFAKINKNIDKSKSFYVGDAAGRKTDFSDTDYKFAINVGVRFYAAYHGEIDFNTKDISRPMHPLEHVKDTPTHVDDCEKQEMIILVGPPACSKSSWAKEWVKYHDNYVIACQDELHTKSKVIKFIKTEIKKKKSIIVDRQNEKIKTRKEFIDIAKESCIKVRILWFNIPKNLAEHLSTYRKFTEEKDIPNVVFNKYYSEKEGVGLEIPSVNENVDDVINMYFSVSKDKIMNEELFFSFPV